MSSPSLANSSHSISGSSMGNHLQNSLVLISNILPFLTQQNELTMEPIHPVTFREWLLLVRGLVGNLSDSIPCFNHYFHSQNIPIVC